MSATAAIFGMNEPAAAGDLPEDFKKEVSKWVATYKEVTITQCGLFVVS